MNDEIHRLIERLTAENKFNRAWVDSLLEEKGPIHAIYNVIQHYFMWTDGDPEDVLRKVQKLAESAIDGNHTGIPDSIPVSGNQTPKGY